jgi:hypothetical protein
LLSSPCELYSLGIIAVRTLLANGQSNLPIVIDDVLSLARHVGKDAGEEKLETRLRAVLDADKRLLDLLSPHLLVERELSPEHARAQIQPEIWLGAMALLLRLFPGAGAYSYCKDFGDVTPLAIESVFDGPIQELETLVLRLRSVLAPSLSANNEIAEVLVDLLATA